VPPVRDRALTCARVRAERAEPGADACAHQGTPRRPPQGEVPPAAARGEQHQGRSCGVCALDCSAAAPPPLPPPTHPVVAR
jgi:hypothetical protein